MKLVIVYKNFAAWQGISHIGLGVAASMNAEVLRDVLGIDVTVLPAHHNVDIVDYLKKNPDTTHVVISAPWLSALDINSMATFFSKMQFVVISHSNVGFLQADNGGIALLRQYINLAKELPNFQVGGNSLRFTNFLRRAYGADAVSLPNMYALKHPPRERCECSNVIKIGIFGAIRPQKNVLSSAAATILIQKELGISVELNLSTGREDGGGSVILAAVRELCKDIDGLRLVERHWTNWREFRRVVADMDLMLQVSYTESFNIVTADGLAEGVPSVVSNAIFWAPDSWKAEIDDVENIAHVGLRILKHRDLEALRGRKALLEHNEKSLRLWEDFLYERSE